MNNIKLTYKHSVINKKVRNSINIEDSIHAKSIQRSNFLQIDNELMQEIYLNPAKLVKMNQNLAKRKLAPGEIDNDVTAHNNEEIHLKFCKT